MKNILLFTVFLVVAATKLMAQNSIEIKKNENNQFKIAAKEEMEINLKFKLDHKDEYNVVVLDSYKKTVFSKKHFKEGENKITFSMEEGEQYLVKFISITPIKLVVTTFDEN